MATFVQAAQEEGVCIEYSVAFLQSGPRQALLRVVNVIKHSTSKVIMAFMTHREVKALVEELQRQNITGLQWIGSDAWITDDSLTDSEGHTALIGALGFVVSRAKIPGLGKFLQQLHPSQFPYSTFLKEFWENVFNCTFNTHGLTDSRRLCSGSENLSDVETQFTDVSELRFTNNVYKAVYAVAHALHNLLTCEEGQGPLPNNSCARGNSIEPWQRVEVWDKGRLQKSSASPWHRTEVQDLQWPWNANPAEGNAGSFNRAAEGSAPELYLSQSASPLRTLLN
ncbi:hypothetical protein GJAV_G00055340 [Gymnothorax javanicus]|nr:hypothetical protein GJAV_G00055340 [Gymnothorax javanicus]